jgi:tetratricopeptide (TPR) repeat protein
MGRRRSVNARDTYVHPLSYVRAQCNWTYQDVARLVAQRIRTACRREKVWRWEHWGVVPDWDSQLALAAELDISSEQVCKYPWPQWLPTGDPVRASYGWTQAGSLEALEDAVKHAAVDRRGFMVLLGTEMVTLAEDWLEVEPAELAAIQGGGKVTIDFVERIEEGLPRLRFLDASYGGQRARRLIDAEFGVVVDLLTRSSYASRVARRLHALAAELGRMAGWSSFDAGLHSAAQRYWIAGLHAAHVAGDTAVGANILKSMSLQSYDFGRRAESLALAASAHQRAAGATPRTVAMLALREARAHAALGQTAACGTLMAKAETYLCRADDRSDDPLWSSYFDEAEFHAQVGTCYLDLGQSSKADHHFASALALFPAAKVRDRATYLIRRAAAKIQLGQGDSACQLAIEAVPLIEQAPSQRNVERLKRVRGQLPFTQGDHRVRELDERLTGLRR